MLIEHGNKIIRTENIFSIELSANMIFIKSSDGSLETLYFDDEKSAKHKMDSIVNKLQQEKQNVF